MYRYQDVIYDIHCKSSYFGTILNYKNSIPRFHQNHLEIHQSLRVLCSGRLPRIIFVAPNTINFNYVFSNFGAALADSPLVLVVIIVLYIPIYHCCDCCSLGGPKGCSNGKGKSFHTVDCCVHLNFLS